MSQDKLGMKPSEKRIKKFTPLIEIVGGGACYVIGDDLTNWGYARSGWFFHYLVLCSCALLSADLLCRVWRKRNLIWIGFGLLCVIMFVVYSSLSPGPTKAKPHLVLHLRSSESPDSELAFNGDFLMFPPGELTNVFASTLGHVEIPIQMGHSNVVVRFALFNDSDVTVENAEFFAHIDKQLKCDLDTNWVELWPKSPYPELRSFAWRVPNAVLPLDGSLLPNMIFFPAEFEPDHTEYQFIIQFKAKNIPMNTLIFQAVFPKGQRFVEPHVLRANKVGTNSYRITIPFDPLTNADSTK